MTQSSALVAVINSEAELLEVFEELLKTLACTPLPFDNRLRLTK